MHSQREDRAHRLPLRPRSCHTHPPSASTVHSPSNEFHLASRVRTQTPPTSGPCRLIPLGCGRRTDKWPGGVRVTCRASVPQGAASTWRTLRRLGAEAGGGHGKPADSLVNYTRSSVIRRIGLFLVGVIKRSPPRNSKEPAVALLKPERLRANTLSSCAAHRGGRKRDARQSCAGGSPERKCTDETHATNNFGRAA